MADYRSSGDKPTLLSGRIVRLQARWCVYAFTPFTFQIREPPMPSPWIRKLPAIAVLALAACAASTGVIPIGNDTYSISHRDNGPLSSLGALKAAAYKDATAY